MRLDQAVSQKFELSRRAAREAVRSGRVDVDGEPCDEPGQEVPEGAKLHFHAHRPLRRHVKTRLVVLYEDDDVLIVDKPAGPAHGSDRGREKDTLWSRALHYLQHRYGGRPYAGHRPPPRQGHVGRARLRAQPRRAPRAPGPLPHARDRPRVRRPRRGNPRRGRHVRRGPRPRAGAAPDRRPQGPGGPARRHTLQDRRAPGRRRPGLDPPGDRAHTPDPRALFRGRTPDPRRPGLRKTRYGRQSGPPPDAARPPPRLPAPEDRREGQRRSSFAGRLRKGALAPAGQKKAARQSRAAH